MGHASDGRAADAVVAVLEARIMENQLASGTPLPAERVLMEQFGTSRTVIREAIAVLAARGLVESRPRFRPIVRKPSFATVIEATEGIVRNMLSEPEGVRNLYDSRIFLERTLVRDAALTARREEIAELEAALVANRATIQSATEFYRTDTEFHGVLYRISGNPILKAVHQGYTAWLSPQWEKLGHSPERNQRNYDSHAAIVEAIVRRDPDQAEALLLAHLTKAWERVRVIFEAESG